MSDKKDCSRKAEQRQRIKFICLSAFFLAYFDDFTSSLAT